MADTNSSRRLTFPDGFRWGSSTAAARIETASDHQWRGFVALDGSVLKRTIDHELHREEDRCAAAPLLEAPRQTPQRHGKRHLYRRSRAACGC